TDELRAGAGYPYVHLERRALPRPLALLLHQPGELLFVDLEPTLGRELLRQLPREAERVVQAERVLGRDLALRDHLFEQLLAAGEQRLERVDVEERIDSLQDHRRPLEAHSRVDVLPRQRRQGAVFREIEFHEDQIPELEKPLALTAGSAGRPATAVLLAAVVVELAAGAAWTRIGRLPEVLGARESDDPFARHISLPARDRDLVLAELQLWIAGEDRRPQTLRLELHPLGHELPGE